MITNSREFVDKQYSDSSNLDIRIGIHAKYSTGSNDWGEWVFDNMKFNDQSNIIEFGCGSGALWVKNKNKIKNEWKITLTDLSEGMINKAKENIGEAHHITYKVMDIQANTFDDSLFDVAIANHMLYHVPNIGNALAEIIRVLRPTGTFYASTNGLGHMREIYEFASEFDATLPFTQPLNSKYFGLENGERQLRNYFREVKLLRFESNLKVTDSFDLAEYMFSIGTELKEALIHNKRYDQFIDFLESKKNDEGHIHISKDVGLFICSN